MHRVGSSLCSRPRFALACGPTALVATLSVGLGMPDADLQNLVLASVGGLSMREINLDLNEPYGAKTAAAVWGKCHAG